MNVHTITLARSLVALLVAKVDLEKVRLLVELDPNESQVRGELVELQRSLSDLEIV